MKTEELEKQGLTKEQIDFVMKQNGKDLAKVQERERQADEKIADLTKRLETAQETLKSFDGVDVDGMKEQIRLYQEKMAALEEKAQQEQYQRDFNKALESAMSDYQFTSEGAKRDVYRQIQEADLQLKDGRILGLKDLVATIQEADKGAFVDVRQKELEATRAKASNFTGKHQGGQGKKLTMSELMKLKNDNPDLNLDSYF